MSPRPFFATLAGIVLLLSAPAGASAGAPDPAAVNDAISFRQTFGLRADEAFVRASFE